MNVVPYIALFERFWIDTTLGGVNAVTVCAAVGACVLLSNLMSFNSIVWKMTMDGMGKSVKWALRNYKSNISKPTYAIVTGASEGMGKEFAKELASAGYNVIIMARTQAKLDEVAKEINKYTPKAKVVVLPFDFSCGSAEKYKELESSLQQYTIDVLINNVAMNHAFPVPFIEEDPQLIDNILEVNVRAQLLITRMVLPQMIQRKCGLIINNGSATGSVPCAYLSVYSASKAFLKTWSQALAFEVKSKGVHVEHINTFFVTTRMSKIRKPSFTTPTPSAYARSVLRNIGYATSSSLFPPHALLDWILSYFPEQFKINRGAEMHLAIRKRALKKQQKTQ